MPIFDQGYQHWTGELSGHAWRWLAIARHGVRVKMKGRILRLVLIVAWMPAFSLAAVLCLWGLLERKSSLISSMMQVLSFLGPQVITDPRHYRTEIWTICYDYFLRIQLPFAMILIVLVGPNLISQDLRFNALPLYLSRPLRRFDYFAGKLGVIAWFLARIIILPGIVAYCLGLLFSLDITIIRDTWRILMASVVYGLIITFSAGLLILALSSLSRSSRYVALFWLGLWFVSGITGGLLHDAVEQQREFAFNRQFDVSHEINAGPGSPRVRGRQRRQFAEWPLARREFEAERLLASRSDWRPMVSYTANLSRLGSQLLGTARACESIKQVLPMPPHEKEAFVLNVAGAQYPWYWSAGVLTGLLGLSVCILNLNIRSLDRLK